MADWGYWIGHFQGAGVSLDPGLTNAEVAAVESRFGFEFPPDLREFLQCVLPTSPRFPNWRAGEEAELRDWLDLPRRGVLFDIEHNAFWLEEWGPRPSGLAEAKEVAERLIAAAPRLIPVYMHRMMPDSPHESGNPVFSVHQTDIIVYGVDLQDYLAHEFVMSQEEQADWTVPAARRIAFWDTDRFQAVRWGPDGSCAFDNSRGLLP